MKNSSYPRKRNPVEIRFQIGDCTISGFENNESWSHHDEIFQVLEVGKSSYRTSVWSYIYVTEFTLSFNNHMIKSACPIEMQKK